MASSRPFKLHVLARRIVAMRFLFVGMALIIMVVARLLVCFAGRFVATLRQDIEAWISQRSDDGLLAFAARPTNVATETRNHLIGSDHTKQSSSTSSESNTIETPQTFLDDFYRCTFPPGSPSRLGGESAAERIQAPQFESITVQWLELCSSTLRTCTKGQSTN